MIYFLVINKILQSLTLYFENEVATIKELKYLNEMLIDELQGSLVAHEYHLNLKKFGVAFEKELQS